MSDDGGWVSAPPQPPRSHRSSSPSSPRWLGTGVLAVVVVAVRLLIGSLLDDDDATTTTVPPPTAPGTFFDITVPSGNPFLERVEAEGWFDGCDTAAERLAGAAPLGDLVLDRLADATPASFDSYLVGYDGPASLGANDVVSAAVVLGGALDGFSTTYLVGQDVPGGWTITVYEFPDQATAIQSEARAYTGVVCELGADPFPPPTPSGAVAAVDSASASVLWVDGPYLFIVDWDYYDGDSAAAVEGAGQAVAAVLREVGR